MDFQHTNFWPYRRWLWPWLGLCLLLTVGTPGWACPEQRVAYQLNVPMIIDHDDAGIIWIRPHKQPELFFVETKALVSLLQNRLNATAFHPIRALIAQRSCISLAEIKTHLPQLTYDENLLILRLTIPLLNKRSGLINYSSDQIARHDLQRVVHQAAPSLYINNSVQRNYNSESSLTNHNRQNSWNSHHRLVANLKGAIFEQGGNFQQYRAHSWMRDEGRVSYDDPIRRLRWTAGDIFYPTTHFQRSSEGRGVAVYRDSSTHAFHNFANNEFNTQQITVRRPSILETYLNQTLIDRRMVMPGPLDLQNLPFVAGENQLELRLTDQYGQSETYRHRYFSRGDLLLAGQNEFLLRYGQPAEIREEKRYYRADQASVSAFYRHGVHSRLSLGLNGESDGQSQMLGSEFKIIFPFAFVALDFGRSADTSANGGQTGHAALFGLQSIERWGPLGHQTHYRLQYQHQERSFHRVGESASELANQSDLYLTRRFKIDSANSMALNCGLGIGHRDYRSSFDSWAATLDASTTIWEQYALGFNYNQEFKQGRDEQRILFTLSWSDRTGLTHASGHYNQQDQQLHSQVQHKILRPTESYLTSVNYDHAPDSENIAFDLSANYPRFETQWYHSTLQDNHQTPHLVHDGDLTLRFALATVGGSWAIGRPVTDGFAIIKTDPMPDDFTIPVGRGGQNFVGAITPSLPLLLPDLGPYKQERFQLDSRNMPLNAQLKQESVATRVPYKGGALLAVPLQHKVGAMITILAPNQTPLALATGHLRDPQDGAVTPFFSNRQGRVFIESLPWHLKSVELEVSTLTSSGEQRRYLGQLDLQAHPRAKDGIVEFGKLSLSEVTWQ